VVHHALCNLIEPLFERSFIADSYANRVGKGNHRALDRAQRFARRCGYVLQCDIQRFFPGIDHEILKRFLWKKVLDQDLRWLMGLILESGTTIQNQDSNTCYFPGDDLFSVLRPRGLPIGNLTSQFWANVYLNPFDHFIKRQLRCRGYLRFVDDFLLFSDDKKMLWEWRKLLEVRLASLRLRIHPGAQPRPVSEGFPFLGFVVFPDRRRLKRRKGIYYQRKLAGLVKALEAGEISLAEVNASVQGWVNHVRYGNTVGLRRAVLGKHPIRLTAHREEEHEL
jgi:hypothetical protein